jgi:four helix bundle protein
MINNYKDLEVWKNGMDIVGCIYNITDKFPKSEQFSLTDQMRRAAISIPSNIAEGHIPYYTAEFKRYCRTSLGSCAELDTQLIIAKRRKYTEDDEFNRISDMIDHEIKMLVNLIKKLKG